LFEVLRVVQFYNVGAYACMGEGEVTEDGYVPGTGNQECPRHDSDYATPAWVVDLGELLRLVQLYNLGGYEVCAEGEPDGLCGVEGAGS
jgi:hypothetical protein